MMGGDPPPLAAEIVVARRLGRDPVVGRRRGVRVCVGGRPSLSGVEPTPRRVEVLPVHRGRAADAVADEFEETRPARGRECVADGVGTLDETFVSVEASPGLVATGGRAERRVVGLARTPVCGRRARDRLPRVPGSRLLLLACRRSRRQRSGRHRRHVGPAPSCPGRVYIPPRSSLSRCRPNRPPST